MQLYLPALTGRDALIQAHVFMLESTSSHAEKADVGAQGQQPGNLKPPRSSWQPGSCLVTGIASHSQPVEGDNEALHCVSVTTVPCPCNLQGCVQVGFGGAIGESVCGGANDSIRPQCG